MLRVLIPRSGGGSLLLVIFTLRGAIQAGYSGAD